MPSSATGKHLALHFPGLNYRANVWVNGKKIADAKDVVGTYRIFEFDVTSRLKPAATTRWRWKFLLREKTILELRGWTGIRLLPTKIRVSGKKCR